MNISRRKLTRIIPKSICILKRKEFAGAYQDGVNILSQEGEKVLMI